MSGPFPLLSVRGVCKRYGSVLALKDVSLTVHKNEIVGLIGPNGAGKTTLFNCLTGFEKADQGTFLLSGRVIDNSYPPAVVRQGMARTFQTARLFNTMTVLENVMVGGHVCRKKNIWMDFLGVRSSVVENKKMAAYHLELLQLVGLYERRHTMAAVLSYGCQRYLEIARALASKPQILVLDEPAAGLNTQETAELARLMRCICTRGISILVIEHDMTLVMDVCDQMFVLNYGTMLAEGTAQDIQNHPDVIAAYLGTRKDAAS